ncbi:beta-hexosaminidase subunit alpha-like isoform X1 [Styela clava]
MLYAAKRLFLGFILLSACITFVYRVPKSTDRVVRTIIRSGMNKNVPDYSKMRGSTTRTGSVWPKPQSMVSNSKMYVLSSSKFKFEYTLSSLRCDDVDETMKRYMKIIFGNTTREINKWSRNSALEILYIHLSYDCEDYPTIKSSERYVLSVQDTAMLIADTQWGVMRGLETFSQLVHINEDNEIAVNACAIEDFPRFQYRGLMLDTARHFIPTETILQTLEIMSYNKLNVLHWHITDHQSFPLEFKRFPEIARHGAFDNGKSVYREEDVKRIVEFARLRGIRVIPEIDLPGHASALAKSRPDLFLNCYSVTNGVRDDSKGTLDPLNPEVYTFIGALYSELKNLFPDEYIHIGGDEISHECWLTSSEFRKYMVKSRTTEKEIHRMFIEGILQKARKLNLKPIAWDDVFSHGYTETPATIEVWTVDHPEDKVGDLTDASVDVIVSYPWYLDNTLKRQWDIMYLAKPAEYVEQKNLHHVLGGESCMWTEHVEANNVITEIWPLASAAAERLWSSKKTTDLIDAETRLNNLHCVMKCRNVHITPILPGVCNIG